MASEKTYHAIEAQKLTVGYRNNEVVSSELNFGISEGQLVALVGANGVGKSTLLRTLVGMQPELNGSVLVKGKSLKEYTASTLASELSIVLTEAPASKNLTVLEFISLGRQPHTNWFGKLTEADKNAIQISLDATDTQSLRNRKCFELSDGQLQRVYIARALAQDTPIIILDEPTTHLDLYHRAYILKLLKKLVKDKKKTILFSTHEIDLAIQLVDKMLVMTPNSIYYGTSHDLIEENRFDSLFPKDTIDFDKKTGRFGVKK